MENFDDIRILWNANSHFNRNNASMSSEQLDEVISRRLKKVKSSFREYFWTSFFYQNLVYAWLVFLIVKFIGRPDIVILSAAGILLYIPYTIIFFRKFKAAFLLNEKGMAYSNDDLYLNIKNNFERMSGFFRIKKLYDLVLIPLNCGLIVVINFILFVPGGFMANLGVAFILLIIWFVLFIIAIRIENRKKFIEPLSQLKTLLDEFKNPI